MERKPNKLRAKLARGCCVSGTVVFSWSPYVVDVAGLAGLDFLRIDTEHSWRRDESLEHLVRAALMGDVVPLVRIDRDDPYLARKALEIGAGGIIVPDICSVEQAEAVVRSAKFPPRGDRGYSGMCWSGGWGAKAGADWVTWNDTEPMIGIMIENVTAMDSIDDIMAVDGVDFALFGPADYSMSLGLGAPKAGDERVQEAIRETVAAARKSGKHVSLGVGTDPDNIKKYADLGIDMLELGSDLGAIRATWSRAAKAAADISARA